MDKNFLKSLLYLIFFIFGVNLVADKFYLYSSIWYFDMIMHFLGGLWVGLIYLYFYSSRSSFVFSANFITKTILFVLIIGMSWEVFEFFFKNIIAQNSFNLLDTVSDLFFDLVGGIFAILYFIKKSTFFHKNKVK